MAPATLHHGRARQRSGTGPCGYCRRVLWVPGPRGLYSGKIRFIEKPGVQGEGGRHVAKRSSDPPDSLSRSQCSGTGPSASCGYCLPLAPRGFSIRRKLVLSIRQAKSSIPALSYFQVGGMKHDQELYA